MGLNLKDWLVVVPARLASTRLPRKPLADLGGVPLIVRVAQNLAPLAKRGAEIVVATDSIDVMQSLAAHKVFGVMTRVEHESGTDRCAEAARGRPQPYILNVQGDEPFVDTQDLMNLCDAMQARAEADMGTLVHESSDRRLAADPNAVKALRRHDGYALYFSRAPLPYKRESPEEKHVPDTFWQHLGVYAFRRERLEAFAALPPSPLEHAEKLEQLRALQAGWRIYLAPAHHPTRGIDTPEDLEAARARF